MTLRLLVVTMLLSISCAQTLPLDGAPCPCASGWVCCPSQNICAKTAAECPAVAAPTISPSPAAVSVTRRLTFSSSDPVDYAIEEAAGGTIDASGLYIAPATPGTYHLVATRKGSSVTARVEITVSPLKLASLAGRYGGLASVPIDGVGEDARFAQPSGGVFIDGYYYLLDGSALTFAGATSLRRVELATGTVETIYPGFFIPYPGTNLASVSDGPKGTATVAAPGPMTPDGLGHLIFGDACLIRSLNLADLSITTLRGDPSLATCVNGAFIRGVAVDGADHLFFSTGDSFQFEPADADTVISQLTISTGAVSIIAGQPGVHGTTDGLQGTFEGIGSLVYFKEGGFNGQLLALDDHDQRVRSVDLVTGEISTLASPVGAQFVGVTAPPSSYGGMLAQADGTLTPDDNRLQEFHPVLPVHPTGLAIASATSPMSNAPPCGGTWTCPVALMPTTEGPFYRYNFWLGLLDTIAGRSGSPPEARDGNGESASFELGSQAPLLATVGDDVFLWEPSGSIRKIDRAANVTTVFTGVDAQLLTGDADTLYRVSANVVLKAPAAGGSWTVVAGSAPGGTLVDGTGAAASFQSITGLAVEPNGKLAVLDSASATATLRELDPKTGVVKSIGTLPDMFGGNPLVFNFPAPAMSLGPAGKLLVLSNYGVHLLDLADAHLDDLFIDTMNGNPYGAVAFDSGHAYLTRDAVVDQLDISTKQITTLVGKLGQGAVRPGSLDRALLHRPGPMALLPNGDLAVVDLEERVLVEVK